MNPTFPGALPGRDQTIQFPAQVPAVPNPFAPWAPALHVQIQRSRVGHAGSMPTSLNLGEAVPKTEVTAIHRAFVMGAGGVATHRAYVAELTVGLLPFSGSLQFSVRVAVRTNGQPLSR